MLEEAAAMINKGGWNYSKLALPVPFLDQWQLQRSSMVWSCVNRNNQNVTHHQSKHLHQTWHSHHLASKEEFLDSIRCPTSSVANELLHLWWVWTVDQRNCCKKNSRANDAEAKDIRPYKAHFTRRFQRKIDKIYQLTRSTLLLFPYGNQVSLLTKTFI